MVGACKVAFLAQCIGLRIDPRQFSKPTEAVYLFTTYASGRVRLTCEMQQRRNE